MTECPRCCAMVAAYCAVLHEEWHLQLGAELDRLHAKIAQLDPHA